MTDAFKNSCKEKEDADIHYHIKTHTCELAFVDAGLGAKLKYKARENCMNGYERKAISSSGTLERYQLHDTALF